jgi:hypothetical protein
MKRREGEERERYVELFLIPMEVFVMKMENGVL